jgi:hypothetical protein
MQPIHINVDASGTEWVQINVNASGTEWGDFTAEEIINAVETAAAEYAARYNLAITVNVCTTPQKNTSRAAKEIFDAAWFALTGELAD